MLDSNDPYTASLGWCINPIHSIISSSRKSSYNIGASRSAILGSILTSISSTP
uniref:Uncharacterized protein n=1 Tax=uncultured marine virus TaxID=186617 RepID=A0A0F7L871_9VIRU|nr:hypothetical protein [uncultured marine virus]